MQQKVAREFCRAFLNFATNKAPVEGNTVAEAFGLDMNQASPISFVSYWRKPLQLQSNYFTSKDTLRSAYQAIQHAVGVPKLWSVKNNQNLKKYCTNSNFAACGLVLRYDTLEDDVGTFCRWSWKYLTWISHKLICARTFCLSKTNCQVVWYERTTLFGSSYTRWCRRKRTANCSRAHRGFFTVSNVGAFIATTLKKLSNNGEKISYLKEKLLVAKRGGREEKLEKLRRRTKSGK